MGAVGLVALAETRRHRAALLGFAVIVALVATAVLGSVAGARRTASALDRFRDATRARDAGAFAFTLGSGDGPGLVSAMRRLEGVAAAGGVAFVPTDALFDIDVTVQVPLDPVMYSGIDRPLLLDGRMPDPSSTDEAVVSEEAVERLGLHTGDHFRARTFSPADCEALASDDFVGFNGDQLDLRVVGEVRVINELQGGATDAGPSIITTPAFADAHHGSVCATGVAVATRFGPGRGPSPEDLNEAALAAVPGAAQVGAQTIEEEFLGSVRSAVDVAVSGLVAFAIVTAVAGGLAVGQAVARQVATSADVVPTLDAIGLTERERAVALTLPRVAAGAVGAVAGVLGAVAVSPLFPIGVARRAEPDPGLAVDGGLIVLGVLVLVAAIAVIGLVATRRIDRRSSARPRPAGIAGWVARAGSPPAVVVGVGLAASPGEGRGVVRTALAGVVVATAGVCAVAVLSSSLTTVLDDPDRYGWAWSAKPDLEGDDPQQTVLDLTEDDRLDAVGVLRQASFEVDGQPVDAFAIETYKGSLDFAPLSGRSGATDREVVLGGRILEDAVVGDEVSISPPGGGDRALTVVGRAVLPTIDRSSGLSVLVSPETMAELAPAAERGLLLSYAPGVDVAALEDDLEEHHGLSYPSYARPNPPGRLVHLDQLRGLLVALVAFFVALGVAGFAHATAVTTRRHQQLFATLRSLGFRKRSVVGSVSVFSLGIAVPALVIGIPVGVVVGRLAWRFEVRDLAIIDDPTLSGRPIVTLALLVIVAVVAIGAVAASQVVRRRPATVLREE